MAKIFSAWSGCSSARTDESFRVVVRLNRLWENSDRERSRFTLIPQRRSQVPKTAKDDVSIRVNSTCMWQCYRVGTSSCVVRTWLGSKSGLSSKESLKAKCSCKFASGWRSRHEYVLLRRWTYAQPRTDGPSTSVSGVKWHKIRLGWNHMQNESFSRTIPGIA